MHVPTFAHGCCWQSSTEALSRSRSTLRKSHSLKRSLSRTYNTKKSFWGNFRQPALNCYRCYARAELGKGFCLIAFVCTALAGLLPPSRLRVAAKGVFWLVAVIQPKIRIHLVLLQMKREVMGRPLPPANSHLRSAKSFPPSSLWCLLSALGQTWLLGAAPGDTGHTDTAEG